MKNQHDIEQLLSTLSPDDTSFDRAGVKSRLMKKISEKPIPSLYYSHVRRFGVSIAMLCILFTGTSYASLSSLPGEPLYIVKVNVAEELVALTKRSPDTALDYAIERLETRQFELVTLQRGQTPLVTSVADDLSEQLTEDINTIESIVDSIKVDAKTEEVLSKLARMKSLVITNNDLTADLLATTSVSVAGLASENNAVEIFESEVAEYVASTATSTVIDFVSDQLSEIEDVLLASSTPNTLHYESEMKLQTMIDYLNEENFTEAIIETLELAETLDVNS
ncbi:MAG: hypothetical protein ACK4SL_04365 [Candidatus Paceibacteria bacterium]